MSRPAGLGTSQTARSRCAGFTIVEALTVIAVIAITLAFLIPAVQRARHSASFMQGQNQLRQIALAIHQYADAHGQQLPRQRHGWDQPLLVRPTSPNFIKSYNIFWHTTVQSNLLPYVDQQAIFLRVMVDGEPPGSLPPGTVITIFHNPLDPTPVDDADPDYFCSYVANAQVFSMSRSIGTGVNDGLSNTIFFAEHYRHCRVWFDAFHISAYHRWTNSGMFQAPTFADSGYAPEALTGRDYDFFPLANGDPPRSKAARQVTFQLSPPPDKCDPRQPNAASWRGLQVAMGDGSVRTIHAGISPYIFWAAVTPCGGELDLPDF